ncbi:MAG: nucleotide exchange factor GrpE [Thermomicrobiales bacterium]|jgi:molecular chaperone GrpE|nr:nucleotide exchange factor GrpE [Thermomicrobiales bacterium]
MGQHKHERVEHAEAVEPEAGAAANGAAATPEPAAPPALEEQVNRLQAQVAEYEDRWKRSAAEFINYKRRVEQERSEFARSANGSLILAFLPVLDDLERALANVPADQAQSSWVEGARLVERKFRATLERQGVTPIPAVGEAFDPEVHEAVGGAGHTVVQEYQRGYRLHGRTLRPAMVVVGDEAPAAPVTEA